MTQTLGETTRRQIAGFLPDAIFRALASYHEFSQSDADAEKCKDYAAVHTACKAAIAHVELLLKLAKWADLPDESAAERTRQAALSAMMREAEDELEAYRGREGA